MRRSGFEKPEIKCAFYAFFSLWPAQRVWAVDRGETEEEREATIEYLWHKFVDILLDTQDVD